VRIVVFALFGRGWVAMGRWGEVEIVGGKVVGGKGCWQFGHDGDRLCNADEREEAYLIEAY
jgi:hypothetical protein